MEKQVKGNSEYYAVDLVHIVKSLWKRVWLIIFAGILTAVVTFGVFAFAVEPEYSSSIMLYVNNSSFSLGNTSFSISSSEITAAQSLVRTYGEILNNRTTLERIIEKTKVKYDYKKLSKMIESSLSNDTEIMRVTVTTGDPYEAAKIANCIAEVLPVRISEIIDGASMEVVDSAIPNLEKVAPDITKCTVIGFVLGAMVAVILVIVATLLDDTIHDEEYVIQTYDYPILAKIPNLLHTGSKQRGYYQYGNSKKK